MTHFDPLADNSGLPAAFRFSVSFGDTPGVADCAFQEVSGIAAEPVLEGFEEGGENRFVHALPNGIKHPTLLLQRGVVPVSAPLVAWCREVMEGALSQPVKTRQVRVSLLDTAGLPLRVWVFESAYPVKWVVEAFSSSKQEVVIEQVALHYQSVTRER